MSWLNLSVLVILFATIGVLVLGVASMAHGGAYDTKHSTQFMTARVALQALAVLAILAAIFFKLMS